MKIQNREVPKVAKQPNLEALWNNIFFQDQQYGTSCILLASVYDALTELLKIK